MKEINNIYDIRHEKTIEKLNSFGGIHCKNESYGKDDNKTYIEKAQGAYIYDFDGNKYLDFSMGGGTTLLGHAPKNVLDDVSESLYNGTIYTSPNMKTHELSNKLNDILYLDEFVYCNSGAEATSRAMRIARAYTKKDKIAVFSGGWHGSHDYGLVDDTYKGDDSIASPVFKSKGVPSSVMDTMILLPYNNSEAFNIIRDNKDEIAAVIIEPSQGSNPRSDMKEFLQELRSVTKELNILLCFDEIITGFRISLAGAQDYYDIDIDLATYAKAIGGGFPFGIVAGKSEIMSAIVDEPVFMGGTFSANPISITSSLSVINHLQNNDIYSNLNDNAIFVKESINNYCIENSVPIRVSNFGSMFRLIFTDKHVKSRKDRDKYEISYEIQNMFYNDLLNNGIFIGSNRINFLSTEHTQEMLEEFVKKLISTIEKFRGVNLI
jgi:glutamate-1-semialdehyde 2,1-aminomutase